MLGQHILEYTYKRGEGTKVSEVSDPRYADFKYSQERWEADYEASVASQVQSIPTCRVQLINNEESDVGDDADDGELDDHDVDADSCTGDRRTSFNGGYPRSSGVKQQDGSETGTSAQFSYSAVRSGDDGGDDGELDDHDVDADSSTGDRRTSSVGDDLRSSGVKQRDGSETGTSAQLSYGDLRPDLLRDATGVPLEVISTRHSTRMQLASVKVADVTPAAICDVTAISIPFTPVDPSALCQRPCESIVTKAEQLVKQGRNVRGVTIPNCGEFDESGLAILRKYCTMANVRREVASECRWLDEEEGLQDSDKAEIGLALWHNNPRHVILKYGAKSIDVESFTLLALERYVDNMVIDVSIEMYLQETQRTGRQDTIYLPCEFWQWLTCPDSILEERLVPLINKLHGQRLNQVLVPVHMVNHWGLIHVNVQCGKIHFDDGMKRNPAANVLNGIRRVLQVINAMLPDHEKMSSQFWLNGSTVLQRFGMPSQTAESLSKSGEGAGSCGVGVILAARDFIFHGPGAKNNFSWTFDCMGLYRKQLMLQILHWASDKVAP